MPASPSTEAAPEPLRLSAVGFQQFCAFITRELGIKMSDAKLPMLQSRLQRRPRELRLPSLEAYREHLFNTPAGAEELVHFIDAVTTNKTDFFREPQHFTLLTERALPQLDPDPARPWHAKVWCAGCSSGEEPYTLAMVLAEHGRIRSDFDFSILATDVSSRMLEHATRAIYAADRIAPVAASLRTRYLLKSRDQTRQEVRIVPALRSKVTFHRLNFMDGDYGVRDTFDVIFFRNVMIYFDKPTQEAVINKLCRHLRPGGYLFVGHSESLGGLQIPVQPVATAVYRKNG